MTDAESPIERGFKDCGEGMRVCSEGARRGLLSSGVRGLALSHLPPGPVSSVFVCVCVGVTCLTVSPGLSLIHTLCPLFLGLFVYFSL